MQNWPEALPHRVLEHSGSSSALDHSAQLECLSSFPEPRRIPISSYLYYLRQVDSANTSTEWKRHWSWSPDSMISSLPHKQFPLISPEPKAEAIGHRGGVLRGQVSFYRATASPEKELSFCHQPDWPLQFPDTSEVCWWTIIFLLLRLGFSFLSIDFSPWS